MFENKPDKIHNKLIPLGVLEPPPPSAPTGMYDATYYTTASYFY